ncbi:hypothetical protein ACOKM5_25250 [Streptomyces sp. BH097]|uniref:hypothetical protein n=1 Tax=Streptomyces sp. BH097 TaxID=3410406 RepID=UPI003CF2742D
MTRSHFDHTACLHPKTKAGRATCRREMRAAALGDTASKPTTPQAGVAQKTPTKKTTTAPAKAPAKKTTTAAKPAPAKKSPVRATAAKKATAALAKPAETK